MIKNTLTNFTSRILWGQYYLTAERKHGLTKNTEITAMMRWENNFYFEYDVFSIQYIVF